MDWTWKNVNENMRLNFSFISRCSCEFLTIFLCFQKKTCGSDPPAIYLMIGNEITRKIKNFSGSCYFMVMGKNGNRKLKAFVKYSQIYYFFFFFVDFPRKNLRIGSSSNLLNHWQRYCWKNSRLFRFLRFSGNGEKGNWKWKNFVK